MLAGVLLILIVTAQSGDSFSTLPSDPDLRQKTISRILGKIRSDDVVDSAWGAYQAGEYNLKQHVPALLDLVMGENQRPENRSPFVKKMALDALVRLGAEVAPELLIDRLNHEYHSETLVLLAMGGQKSEAALLLFWDAVPLESQHWWATARIFANSPPHGYARRLAAALQFELTIFVRDSEDKVYRHGEHTSHSPRCRLRKYDELLPPWPEYNFHTSPQDGCEVLKGKPLIVSYSRSEFSSGRPPERETPPKLRCHLAIECLNVVLKGPMKGIRPRKLITIDWQTDDHYFKQATEAYAEIVRVHRELLDSLIAEGLLTRMEAIFMRTPRIETIVEDKRNVKDIAIPGFLGQK